MSRPEDPLANLAESLTCDFNAQTREQLRAAIEEREQILASVPEVTELTDSRKVRGILLMYSLFMLGVGAFCIGDSKAWPAGVICLGIGVFLGAGVWLQREAGKHPLLRLSRTHLWFRTLDAEIDLLDLTQARVKDGRQLHITLTLREGAPLPASHNPVGPMMPKAKAEPSRPPQIRLSMYGLDRNGSVLIPQEVMHLILSHCDAARAYAELQALKARQSDRQA